MTKVKCHFPKEIAQYLTPSKGDVISNPKHIRYCMKSKFMLGYTGGWKIIETKPDFMQLGLATAVEREFSELERGQEWAIDSKHKFRSSFIVYTGKSPHFSATTQMTELLTQPRRQERISEDGLSFWAVAGIILGVLLVSFILILIIYLLVKRN